MHWLIVLMYGLIPHWKGMFYVHWVAKYPKSRASCVEAVYEFSFRDPFFIGFACLTFVLWIFQKGWGILLQIQAHYILQSSWQRALFYIPHSAMQKLRQQCATPVIFLKTLSNSYCRDSILRAWATFNSSVRVTIKNRVQGVVYGVVPEETFPLPMPKADVSLDWPECQQAVGCWCVAHFWHPSVWRAIYHKFRGKSAESGVATRLYPWLLRKCQSERRGPVATGASVQLNYI